ncbi:hypothetical protein A4A49_33597 [Nicotiana attenuata]|uniref:Uncharacterized protein n=1 Tax=Nicotiana attenuata TaxID=49451 RepID=A0A1J6L836_NICAT|nr:hypothetical protein A4A49_33597 [Nicotiana attenuata]
MAQERGRARGRPRLQPLAGIGKATEAPMQPGKGPMAELVITLVPLADARQKQKKGELIVHGIAKRLDLSISPSLCGQKDTSTGKLADLASTSKSTPDLEPAIENKGTTTVWTSLFSDVEKEIRKWRCALTVYVIGETHGYNYIHKFVKQSWNQVAEPEEEKETKRQCQLAPELVGPPKVLQEWRVKKTADMSDQPAEDKGANKSNVVQYNQQESEQRQLPHAICEEQTMGSKETTMEISRVDQIIQGSAKLSRTREFQALSTNIWRHIYATLKTCGTRNHRSLPAIESGTPILSQ